MVNVYRKATQKVGLLEKRLMDESLYYPEDNWSGKRTDPENFVWVDYDTVEQGICLNEGCFMYSRPSDACAGCSQCECILPF